MEHSMRKFLERVFSGNPDFGTLTKAELRRQYFKEHGLSHFSKEEKQMFAALVNQMVVEHAEAIEEAAKKKSFPEASSSCSNGSVDEHLDNANTSHVSNGVEKNVACFSVKGKLKNSIDNSFLKKAGIKTHNKHVFRSDNDDCGGGDNNSDSEALVKADSIVDCNPHQHEGEMQLDSKTVKVIQNSPSKDSVSGSDYLKSSEDKPITDDDIFHLSGNGEENVEATTTVSDDEEEDLILEYDGGGDDDDTHSSPVKKSNIKSQIQLVDTSDDDSYPGALVIHEEPTKARSSDDDQKCSSAEESPVKMTSKKQKSQRKSVDSDRSCGTSSEDEITPVEHKVPKRRASVLSEESTHNDSSLNKSLHNSSFSGHEPEDKRKIDSDSEDSVHSLSPSDKNQKHMNPDLAFREKKPRVLLKRLSAEFKSSNGACNIEKNQNDCTSDSDSESSLIDTDDEPLQKLQGLHTSKKGPDNLEKSGSSKENNSDSNSCSDSISPVRKMKTKTTSKKESAVSKTNAKIEKLKKYVKTAGIHVQSYNKLWESCSSLKAKADKLLELLQKNGLKGHPTIEKCKKLKKKIEKKKEVEELDLSNIIKSEGRPKRNARSMYLTCVVQTSNETTKKRVCTFSESEDSDPQPLRKFSRLRDIIDSEESD